MKNNGKVIFKKTEIITKEYSPEQAFHKILENQQSLVSFAGFFKKFLEENVDVTQYEFTGQKKYKNPFYILDLFKDCAEENRDNIKSLKDYYLNDNK